MNLIILTNRELTIDNHCTLTDDRAAHIIQILKANIGDTLDIGLLNGPRGIGRVSVIDKIKVELECVFETEPLRHPVPEIDIICALPRPQTLKKVLHTVAVMSVRNLYLIRTNRVEKSYFHSPLLREENLHKHLIEGLSQGKLTRLPQVSIHDKFKPFFEDFLPTTADFHCFYKILTDLDCSETLLPSSISSPILLAIGPEGGWIPYETNLMQNLGFNKVKLGPWVLRVENALVAALSQLQLAVHPLD